MRFNFYKLGNRICITTEKENSLYIRKIYVQTYQAKRILNNIKKYNWNVNIHKDIIDLLS